jgi:hypothetical protein
MKTPLSMSEWVQTRLAEAVVTCQERTAEEQRDLIAGLLASAYEAVAGARASS